LLVLRHSEAGDVEVEVEVEVVGGKECAAVMMQKGHVSDG